MAPGTPIGLACLTDGFSARGGSKMRGSIRFHGRRRPITGVVIAVGALILPLVVLLPPALAAVTCDVVGATLNVDLDAGDSVTLSIASGDIVVDPNTDPGACDGNTAASIAVIDVDTVGSGN